MAAEIVIRIVGIDQTGNVFNQSTQGIREIGAAADEGGRRMGAFGQIASGAFQALGGVAIGAALGGISAIGNALIGGIDAARESAGLMAATEQTIFSMGNAAGVSATHVVDLASSLSDAAGMSLFGDDQIQQSENLLLTFGNIKGAAFDTATALTVDLAQALGGAPKDQAMMLGKALNDPIHGMTALGKAGLTFSVEQKAAIAAMQESGDMAGAQKIILDELNKQVGGQAAAAAAAAGGWVQFKARMGEAAETVGHALLPVIDLAGNFLNTVLAPAIETVATGVSDFITSLQGAGPSSAAFATALAGLFPPELQGAVQAVVSAVQSLFSALQTGDFSALTTSLQTLGAQIGPIFEGLVTKAGQWLLDAIPIALSSLATFIQSLVNQAMTLLPQWAATLIQFAIKAVSWIAEALPGLINSLGLFFNRMVTWVVDSLPGWGASLAKLGEKVAGFILDALPGLGTNLGKAAGALLGWIVTTAIDVVPKLVVLAGKFLGWIASDLLPALPGALQKIGQALFNFIGGLLGEIAPHIAPLAQKFLDWAKDLLPKIPGALAGIATGIFTFIGGVVTNVAPKLLELAKKFLSWISEDVIPTLPGTLATISTAINTWVNTAIANVGIWIADLAKKFYLWITETVIPALPGQLASIGTAISTWITTAQSNVATWIIDLAKRFYEWVSGTVIPAIPAELAKINTAISDWVSGAAKTVTEAVKSIGTAIIDGIKAGVLAAWENFKKGLGGLIDQIPQSIRSALGMHSPSVPLVAIGEMIPLSIALGIGQGSPKAVSAMLDLAKQLIDVVSSGVNAFSQLRQLGTVPMSAITQFATTLQAAMTVFGEMTLTWNRAMMSAASQFTYKSGQVIETMAKGIEMLSKLADFRGVPAAAISAFGIALDAALREIVRISTMDMRIGLMAAVAFADAASKVLGIIGAGVDAFAKLKDFIAPTGDVFHQFALAVTAAVGWISHVAAWFQASAVADAASFADSAGKVIAIIAAGVEAFAKLAGFKAPTIELFHQFAPAVVSAVGWISHVAEWFRGVALDQTIAFADAAGKVIAIISGAVDAFLKLRDFQGVPVAAMIAFTQALGQTVQQIAWLSTQWAPAIVAAAAVFAENAGRVVGVLSAGVDGFLKLADFQGVPKTALTAFMQALQQTVQQMAWLSQQWAPAAVAAAGVFAENAGRVVGMLSAGVDAFIKLADFQDLPKTAILAFTQALQAVIGQMAWLSQQWSPLMIAQATAFADLVQQIVSVIDSAVEAFTHLADFHNSAAGVLTAFTQALRDLLAEILRQTLPAATNLGVQIMHGITQGVISATPELVSAVTSAVTAAVNAARTALGIASDSKVFGALGVNMSSGMAGGVREGAGLVTGAVREMSGLAAGAGTNSTVVNHIYNNAITYSANTPSSGSVAQDLRLLNALQGAM